MYRYIDKYRNKNMCTYMHVLLYKYLISSSVCISVAISIPCTHILISKHNFQQKNPWLLGKGVDSGSGIEKIKDESILEHLVPHSKDVLKKDGNMLTGYKHQPERLYLAKTQTIWTTK